jgi:perosamine synthetase
MIPVNTPVLTDREKQLLIECIDSGWVSSEGPFVKEFEMKFSNYVDRKFGVATSSGSAALDIAIKALNIKKGDEVIMPTFTIVSPAFSLIRQGAIPVLVDSDPLTWNMDIEQIESKITSKTKAIIIVHIYGLPVDIDPLIEIARKYNLKIIEDAAEMHGQTYKNRKCGSFGDVSIFSFYPNKHITTGEGGMIVTNSKELTDKARKLRNLSFNPNGRRFIHNDIGWNYRMTNLQASIGIGQLERMELIIKRKREIGRKYSLLLKEITTIQQPVKYRDYAENIYWVYGIVTNSEKECIGLQKFLNQAKIGTRPFFWCMHEQPYFKKIGLFSNEKYPVAEKLARNGFYIPSGLGITDEEIEFVAKTIKNYAKR